MNIYIYIYTLRTSIKRVKNVVFQIMSYLVALLMSSGDATPGPIRAHALVTQIRALVVCPGTYIVTLGLTKIAIYISHFWKKQII